MIRYTSWDSLSDLAGGHFVFGIQSFTQTLIHYCLFKMLLEILRCSWIRETDWIQHVYVKLSV
jgi:hypothetical protein